MDHQATPLPSGADLSTHATIDRTSSGTVAKITASQAATRAPILLSEALKIIAGARLPKGESGRCRVAT
jgi:hypothetical protein